MAGLGQARDKAGLGCIRGWYRLERAKHIEK